MFFRSNFNALRWVIKEIVRHNCTLTTSNLRRVFLFPGQGSQFVGMCERFKHEPWLQNLFDRVSSCVGFDLLQLCLEGPQEELQKTVNCQLAVVTSSLAAVEWCRNHGELMQCDRSLSDDNVMATAGFSVGEFAALVFAKAFSLDDAIKVIYNRAKSMQIASDDNPSGMVTVKGLNEHQIHQLCQTIITKLSNDISVIASYLYPRGYVIAGTMDVIEYILMFGKSKHGAKEVTQLHVSGGFHTPLMTSAQPVVKKVLDSIDVKLPEIPVYSNVTGKPYKSIEEIKMLLVDQIVRPVLWQNLIQNIIIDQKPDKFYEVGPGRQLYAMLCQIDHKYRRHCKNIPV